MNELKYTKDHEWVRLEEGGNATIGITDYAQEQLGDVVYVELPALGKQLTRGMEAVVIESVKAAGEVKSPVSGTVTAVNEALSDEPNRVNAEATGGGWLFSLKLAHPEEAGELMDKVAYDAYLAGLS